MLLNGLNEFAEVTIFLSLFDIGHLIILRFIFKFQVVIVALLVDVAGTQGLDDGATGLARVAAISVTARRCALDDIGKASIYTAFSPEDGKLTHTRIVDDQGATFKDDQLPPDGGMPSFAASADVAGLQLCTTHQIVDDRTLANPR